DCGAERPERGLVGPVNAAGALAALDHKPGLLEHAQVLADRRPGHLELCRDLSRRQLPIPDQLEDAQPAWRGDHLQRFHDASLPSTPPAGARRRPVTGLTPASYFR